MYQWNAQEPPNQFVDPFPSLATELKQIPQWVCFDEKKLPVSAFVHACRRHPDRNCKRCSMSPKVACEHHQRNDYCGDSTDQSTWSTYSQAVSFWKSGLRTGICGIGFVLTSETKNKRGDVLIFVDLDDCCLNGRFTDEAVEIVRQLDSYTEISPSGSGLHILAWGKPFSCGQNGHNNKADRLQKGQQGGHAEIYFCKRYFTVTGKTFEGFAAINERPSQLEDFHRKQFHAKDWNNGNTRSHAFQAETISEDPWEGASAGNRHNSLLKEVRKWRLSGIPEDSALNMATELAAIQSRDFPENEIAGIVDWAYHKMRSDYLLTEAGNVERMQELYAADDFLYCEESKQWLHWDGKRWVIGSELEVRKLAEEVIRDLFLEANSIEDEMRKKRLLQHANRSHNSRAIAGMVAILRHHRHCRASELDSNRYLLNCLNGTVDLRTAELLPHSKEHLITKIAPVNFDAEARHEMWDNFIACVTGGNKETGEFLQVFAGTTLAGEMVDELVPFLIGAGNTGKTTFQEALRATLGDYAMVGNFQTFMPRKFADSTRDDLANYAGKRLVVIEEIPRHARLDSAFFNMATGGSKLRARRKYENETEFEPTFHLIIAANNMPFIDSTESGTWRRVLEVSFDHVIPEEKRDPNIKNTFKYHPEVAGAAILAWMVAGYSRWRRQGLVVPHSIKEQTAGLKHESDLLMQFLESDFGDDYVLDSNGQVRSCDLWHSFHNWISNSNENKVTQREFADLLREHGCTPVKIWSKHLKKDLRFWTGIKERSAPEKEVVNFFR